MLKLSLKFILKNLFLLSLAPLFSHSYTVTVTRDTLQVVDGFGVSVTWSGGEMLGLPEAEKLKALNMFFTPQGADMSILRMRVVAKTDADFIQQVNLGLWAKSKGINKFYATVWDVPSQFLDGNQKLLPNRFGDFADYLTTFVQNMALEGVSIGWIGVQNEPDNGPKLANFTVDYNKYTVHYYRTKSELRDFSVALKKVLVAKNLAGVKLIGPECMGWEGTRELIKNQFETPEGIQAMDIIGTHDYWGAERDMDMNPVRVEMAALAKTHQKKIWQTEYSRVDCLPGCSDACTLPNIAQDPTKIMTEADLNIRDGLEMVNYLYHDFSKANASAWLFWWTHNPNKGCGNLSQGLVGKHNSFNGLAIIREDQTFFFPKRFHTLSHYTRFIRPGSFRIKSISDADAVVHPLAFVDPIKDQVIVVVYNSGASSWPLSLKLTGFENYTGVKHYQTTADADINVKLLESKVLGLGQDFSTQMAAQSISTLVFERALPTAKSRYLAPIKGAASRKATNLKGENVTGRLRSAWNFMFSRNGLK